MRYLIVNSEYEGFSRWLYRAHPGLTDEDYATQLHARNESLFGIADFYSRLLNELGRPAWDVHANNV
jgi:hypothetical protein